MSYLYINNYRSTLAAELTSGQTVMTLNDASPISDASEDNRYKLTLVEVDAGGREISWEIVEAIGVTGNNVTIVRALEGTTSPASWPITTVVAARATAGHLSNFVEAAPAPAEVFVHDIGPLDFATTAASVSHTLPAGRRLFIDTIDIVPLADGGVVGSFTAEAGSPSLADDGRSVAYNHDSSYLAVGVNVSPYLYVFETAGWTTVTTGTYTRANSVLAVDFSPDGSLLAIGGGSLIEVVETSGWTVVHSETVSGTVLGLEFSKDGAKLGWAAADFGVLDVATWTSDFTDTRAGNAVAWNSDGTRMAVGLTASPWLVVFETSGWTEVQTVPSISAAVYDVAYSNDDSFIAAAFEATTSSLAIVYTSDWSIYYPAIPHTNYRGLGVAINPVDGRVALAADSVPNTIYVFTPGAWTVEETGDLSSAMRSVAWAHDGLQLATGNNNSPYLHVYNWEVQAEQPAPWLNIGVDATADRSIVNNAVLAPFSAYSRLSLAPSYSEGVASVRAEVAVGVATGTSARVVINGYTIAE